MPNNVLITGMPGSGKTTLLKRLIGDFELIDDYSYGPVGFLTEERIVEGRRTGFDIVDYGGDRYELATLGAESECRVPSYSRAGASYGVFVPNLDRAVEMCSEYPPLIFLYLDEIGQMELFSQQFRKLVLQFLNDENIFFGTVSKVFEDDFVAQVREREDVRIFEVTPDNRGTLYEEICEYHERLYFD